MNKFALVLIFSFIAFTKETLSIDDFNTEPYYSFDWLDEDEKTFEVQLSSATTNGDTFCYLYNTSVVCKPTCSLQNGNKTISCTLKGDDCKGDKDNPTFKYYYAVYCSESTSSDTVKKSQTAAQILPNAASGQDAEVTIAVCSGSYLKYSLFLLSLLIL